MLKLKFTLFTLSLFLMVSAYNMAHDPEEKSAAERKLEQKHKMIDYMKKAQNAWVWSNRGTGNFIYDSNVNLAPKSSPTTTAAGSFIGTLNYNLMGYRLLYKSSFNVGADAEYKFYTYSEQLNTADLHLFAKGQYFASEQFQMGSHMRVTGHYQPKLIDGSNIILSQNFSYFGVSFVPHWIYIPSKDWRFELIWNVDRKWYQKTDKPGEYPYDNLILQADLSAEKIWNPSYKSKLKLGYTHDKYFHLPAFQLDTLLSTTNKKTLKSWLVKTEHSFPKFYFPVLINFDYSGTKDTYEGYENFYYLQPSVHAIIPIDEDKKHMLTCYVNYQWRQYTKRKTLSSLFQDKVKYHIVQSVVQYDHQITKKFSFFEMASYETRETNENFGQSDRSYNKFIAGVGINYVF